MLTFLEAKKRLANFQQLSFGAKRIQRIRWSEVSSVVSSCVGPWRGMPRWLSALLWASRSIEEKNDILANSCKSWCKQWSHIARDCSPNRSSWQLYLLHFTQMWQLREQPKSMALWSRIFRRTYDRAMEALDECFVGTKFISIEHRIWDVLKDWEKAFITPRCTECFKHLPLVCWKHATQQMQLAHPDTH